MSSTRIHFLNDSLVTTTGSLRYRSLSNISSIDKFDLATNEKFPSTTNVYASTTYMYRSGDAVITFRSDSEDSFTDTEESELEDSTYCPSPKSSSTAKEFIEPLNVVWAKLPETPWLPGVIIREHQIMQDLAILNINAKTPAKEIFASKERTSNDHLVYVFNTKRVWHWVSSNKLKKFGMNDQQFLNKKSKYYTQVKKAYKKALEVYERKKEAAKFDKNSSDFSVVNKELHLNVINYLASPTKLNKAIFVQHSISDNQLNSVGIINHQFIPTKLNKNKSKSNNNAEFDC